MKACSYEKEKKHSVAVWSESKCQTYIWKKTNKFDHLEDRTEASDTQHTSNNQYVYTELSW